MDHKKNASACSWCGQYRLNPMRKPRFPPMVHDIIQTALLACDGVEFSDRSACPACGGAVRGYDTRIKQFAVILEDDRKRIIHVRVRRFTCTSCGRICYADEPFYPGTRTGSPVIDLCLTFAQTIPFCRTAMHLSRLGIAIDRGSVRNHVKSVHVPVPTADMFGMLLPFSLLSLSSLAASAGEGSVLRGPEVLAACGFPSAHREAPVLPPGIEREVPQQEKEERGSKESGAQR